jgi:hypothetical protein
MTKKNLPLGAMVLSSILSLSPSFLTTSRHVLLSPDEDIAASPLQHEDTLRPPRILLGILGTWGISEEVKLRVTQRQTFLSFDKVHNTTTPHRVCSLDEFASKASYQDWNPYECQLVYTFVFGGLNASTSLGHGNDASRFSSLPVVLSEDTVIKDFVKNETDHKDHIVLNVGNSDESAKIWSWYRYAYQYWSRSATGTTGDSHPVNGHRDLFDYVAQTDSTVLMYPTDFWQNPIFLATQPQHGVYSGYEVQGSQCSAKKSEKAQWCPSLEANSMIQRFSLLSIDVVEQLMEVPIGDIEKAYGSLKKTESVDVGLANILHTSISPSVNSTPLQGVKPLLSIPVPRGEQWISLLKDWDKYKDKLIAMGRQYTDAVEEARVRTSNAIKYFDRNTSIPGSRILMGIFTMDNEIEKARRAAVRSTYLSYYKDSHNMRYRICSLQDLLRGSLPNDGIDCQMAYAFVMGSNPNGPTNLVNTTSTVPLTVNDIPEALREETDIVHLNVRENMEDGKTPSWFRFATTVVDEQFYFDYIGKTDTDTLIFPKHFLDVSFAKYPRFPDNVRVFGGEERLKYEWGPRMVGPLYMGGHLYLMSIDLARFVTTTDLRSVDYGIEDMSMGNFVHSHPLPIHRIPIVGRKAYRHPLKDVDEYLQEWSIVKKTKR